MYGMPSVSTLGQTAGRGDAYRSGMGQYVDLSARRRARTRVTGLAVACSVTALLVAAAGAIHLYLWFDYFHRVHIVGALFLVNAGVGLAIAATLLARPSALAVLAAGGYAIGTLAAFVVSTRWGLFGYRESFWGSWQEAAGAVEIAAALLAGAILLRLR
jgi:hypothetical protein